MLNFRGKNYQSKAIAVVVAMSAVLFALFCGGVLISASFMKHTLAESVTEQARRFLINGDYKEAELTFAPLTKNMFTRVSFQDDSARTIFALPIEDSEALGRWWTDFGSVKIRMPITLGSVGNESGSLVFEYNRFENIGFAFALWLVWMACCFPVTRFLSRHMKLKFAREAEVDRLAAIAQTTQMLAHDVRKPFSILRMGLGMLGSAKDPDSVKRVLSRLLPEIDKAVSSVDGLIADVMEVGSTSTALMQEPASPESLIEATLAEIFRVYPAANVSLSYQFRHTTMVNVHVGKVGRVISNIVGNAVQAMGCKGHILFATREHDGWMTFTIGNSGSIIPAENLPKLFDAFFTSGKRGGTGLGLAIAQKVVTAHGGRIWCESSRTQQHSEGQVEFFFTLPLSERPVGAATTALARSSMDISRPLSSVGEDDKGDCGSVDKGELTLEADLIQSAQSLGRPLRVLVVDDEPIYRNALATYLGRSAELQAKVNVIQVPGAEAAAAAANREIFDLIISDVDMGVESLDGFDLVRSLRAEGATGLVCVHSNRILASDHKRAIDAGADAFLPKPMARAQLLRLALQAAGMAQTASTPPPKANPGEAGCAPEVSRPEVLVVDDNPFVLEAWETMLGADAVVYSMSSIEDLVGRLALEPNFLARLTLVITDMHLDGSKGDGIDVGRLVKGVCCRMPVLLSSDGNFSKADLRGAIDQVIGKEPVLYHQLAARAVTN